MIGGPWLAGMTRPSRPPNRPRAPAEGRARPSDDRLDQRLTTSNTFDEVFPVVRLAVRQVLGRERPGLGLALSDLPPGVGAYWPVTGNLIVLNEGLLKVMRRMARSQLEFNAFVYVLLAHEYLHALGYLDETAVREVTARVTREAFGRDHLATALAEGDLWQRYPFLRLAPGGQGQRLTLVRGFDRDTTSNYIR
jgi:hypothetical protein